MVLRGDYLTHTKEKQKYLISSPNQKTAKTGPGVKKSPKNDFAISEGLQGRKCLFSLLPEIS